MLDNDLESADESVIAQLLDVEPESAESSEVTGQTEVEQPQLNEAEDQLKTEEMGQQVDEDAPTSCTYGTDRLKYHSIDFNEVLMNY